MLQFDKINKGKTLRISAINPAEFADYVKDHDDDCPTSYSPNSNQAIRELSEQYWTNGWGVHTADELGQLSECLVIAEDSTAEDDGSITLNGKAWTNINDYMIVNPIDAILENGYVDFELWDTFKNENFENPYANR